MGGKLLDGELTVAVRADHGLGALVLPAVLLVGAPALGVFAEGLSAVICRAADGLMRDGVVAALADGRSTAGAGHGGDDAGVEGFGLGHIRSSPLYDDGGIGAIAVGVLGGEVGDAFVGQAAEGARVVGHAVFHGGFHPCGYVSDGAREVGAGLELLSAADDVAGGVLSPDLRPDAQDGALCQ